jgi:hypothetical protein
VLRDTVPALPFRGDSSVLRSDHFKPIVPVPVPVKGDGAEAEGNSSSYSSSSSNSSSSSSNSNSDISSSIREVSASAPSFLPPVSAPKKRRVVGVSDVNGRAISVSIPVSVSAAPAISDGGGDRGGDTNHKGDSSRNSSSSSSSGGVDESARKRGLRAVRSVTYNGREGEREGEGGVQGGEGGAGIAEEVEKEEEECRPLDSEFHIILMTHAEVRYARTVSYQRAVRTMSHDCDILTAGAIGICVVCCVRVRPSIPGSLPYLTLPYLTLPYLTLPYLTLTHPI